MVGTQALAKKVVGQPAGPWSPVVLPESEGGDRCYREGDWNPATVTAKGRTLDVT